VQSERRRRLRPFLLGGLVGSVAGLAAAGRMRVRSQARRRGSPDGLAAFEQAPCFEELAERESRSERAR
jgi:hypothetical protein